MSIFLCFSVFFRHHWNWCKRDVCRVRRRSRFTLLYNIRLIKLILISSMSKIFINFLLLQINLDSSQLSVWFFFLMFFCREEIRGMRRSESEKNYKPPFWLLVINKNERKREEKEKGKKQSFWPVRPSTSYAFELLSCFFNFRSLYSMKNLQ